MFTLKSQCFAMLTRIKFFSYLNHVTIRFRLGNTVFVQIKSDKVCFQSGHRLDRDRWTALVEKKISNDDSSNRKIAASNKTFTFGFKQNYETNRN